MNGTRSEAKASHLQGMKLRASAWGVFIQTLRVTPAMEAKVTNHVWTIEEILRLLKVS
jgi:hypothetical protein